MYHLIYLTYIKFSNNDHVDGISEVYTSLLNLSSLKWLSTSKKRHYQIPRNGIQLVYINRSGIWPVFVNKKNCLRYIKRYKCELVCGWYTKVIKRTGFQNWRYTFRYTIFSVSERYTNKKKPFKIVYRTFFLLCLYLSHLWLLGFWLEPILHNSSSEKIYL